LFAGIKFVTLLHPEIGREDIVKECLKKTQ
jgi:hypothetical protein